MVAYLARSLVPSNAQTHRDEDPVPGRERFYRRDLDPRRWLRVVVDFNDTPTFVVTAFVQDQELPGITP
jgi:hypothetical protein